MLKLLSGLHRKECGTETRSNARSSADLVDTPGEAAPEQRVLQRRTQSARAVVRRALQLRRELLAYPRRRLHNLH